MGVLCDVKHVSPQGGRLHANNNTWLDICLVMQPNVSCSKKTIRRDDKRRQQILHSTVIMQLWAEAEHMESWAEGASKFKALHASVCNGCNAPAAASHKYPGCLGCAKLCSCHWSLVREDKACILAYVHPAYRTLCMPLCSTSRCLWQHVTHVWGNSCALKVCKSRVDFILFMCRVGKELSGPLVSTLVGLLFANAGLVSGSNAPAVYDTVNKFILPLAIPLLLFSADLRYNSSAWQRTSLCQRI